MIEQLCKERVAGEDRVLPFDMSWAAGVMRNTRGGFYGQLELVDLAVHPVDGFVFEDQPGFTSAFFEETTCAPTLRPSGARMYDFSPSA